MPNDLNITSSLAVNTAIPLAPKTDVVFYGEKSYARQYFAINATDIAGPPNGTNTTLIASVTGKRFVILGMEFVVCAGINAGALSAAIWATFQFQSAGAPTNHTGPYTVELPAGAVNDQKEFKWIDASVPIFETATAQNFRVKLVTNAAGAANIVQMSGFGTYITVP